MNAFVNWFAGTLGRYISKELAVFIVSLFPILECRGGLIAAALLKVPIIHAVPLCIIRITFRLWLLWIFITLIYLSDKIIIFFL